MSELSATKRRLSEEQAELKTLREELPRFQQLVEDNAERESELKTQYRKGKTEFGQVAEARAATHTAREILEQHQADIATAEAEVAELEQEVHRLEGIKEVQAIAEKMAAGEAALRESYAAALRATRDALQKVAGQQEELLTLSQAWRQFTNRLDAYKAPVSPEELEVGEGTTARRLRNALEELRAEGVDVDALRCDPTSGIGNRWERPLQVSLPDDIRQVLAHSGFSYRDRDADPLNESAHYFDVLARYYRTNRHLEVKA